jgi:hypothetical protein
MTTTTSYAKRIEYDGETRDFALYLNEELVGFAQTKREAEEKLDALVYSLLTRDAATPVAEQVAAMDAALVACDTDAYYAALRTANAVLDATPVAPTADAALAEHLAGELRELAEMSFHALCNGERHPGESEGLDAAYDRKKAQLEALGYAVVGPELELAALPAHPRCPKCGEQFDAYGRCGCLYTVNALVAEVVAATRRAYEPDAEERAEVEAWLAELEEAEEIPTPVAGMAQAARELPAPTPVRGYTPVRYFLPDAALVAECIAELRRSADGAQARALDKAAYEVARGAYSLTLADAGGALLVPSRSAGGVVYRVTQAGCSCTAGDKGAVCWHRDGLYEAVLLARDIVAAELDDQAAGPLALAA